MKAQNPKHSVTRKIMWSGALLALFGAGDAVAQQIAARPLTPQEIAEYGLDAGLRTSGGLMTVGVGEPVYLEVQVPKDTEVTGVEWALVERPLGGSVATLEASPLPAEMPIYSVGDREVFNVAERMYFSPDIAGKYIITATVQTAEGPLVLETQVTGAYYTGIGLMGGANPAYPQCALCHEEQSLNFMQTGHADSFTMAIDGHASDHYGESCMSCHVLAVDPALQNGGFGQIAQQVGWTFPEALEPGNWAAMPLELQAVANVQCEHCHGAGSEHHGDKTTISVSMSSGDCGQCHEAEPYHTKNIEWNLSRHAVATRYPTGEDRAACVACHSGLGFVDSLDGREEVRTGYEAITCAACHDPHDATNPHQVRVVPDVELANGDIITAGGTGKLCMQCHKARADGEEAGAKYSKRFGPHHSNQADMLAGMNAVEYGLEIPSTSHLYALDDGCATCHMAEPGSDNAAHLLAGGHTFKPVYDNGTPEDSSDDVDMVGACTDCHGPVKDFNLKTVDHNNDGLIEGVKVEVQKIMDALAMKLPPIGEPTIEVAEDFTVSQLQAAYNYVFVDYDHSKGIHNTRYTVGILKASIADLMGGTQNRILRGQNVPVGGEWFYSSWLGFYAPKGPEAWVYHMDHGHLYIAGTPEAVIYYDQNMGGWLYTMPESFPRVYSFSEGAWLYYTGKYNGVRWFYNASNNQWLSYP